MLRANFDDGPGTTVTNLGSAGGTLDMRAVGGGLADLHTANGGGVSGQPGDYGYEAFGNPAATGVTADGRFDFGTFSDFTISGWYYQTASQAAELQIGERKLNPDTGSFTEGFQNFFRYRPELNAGNTRIELFGSGGSTVDADPGDLQLRIGGTAGNSFVSNANTYTATDEWVFYAVTYDGTSSGATANFYVGSKTSAPVLAGTSTVSQLGGFPAFDFGEQPVSLGNRPFIDNGGANRSLNATMDDARFYVGDVLDLAALDTVRLEAIGVPEPATGMLALGALLMSGIANRRSRSDA
ncbi:LamG domain-containing protein [Posidoniimonas polymericola]|uniref:LamG domain-containing protein n=1 Tax=Posidoniimonas polymericola TaxID=2528002 RepID=UPI0011B3E8C8|nr:LamG domain-containing protein [Posidoniimonas polymericola]